MSFHRTPAEMADDVSFARSPVGCSNSRHLLWLTDDDLERLGTEPARNDRRIDFDDPAAVAAERERTRLWKIWWDRACVMFDARRREALKDEAWTVEYMRLIRLRKEAGPSEMEAIRIEAERFEAANPKRGLSLDEREAASLNWKRRWEICREINRLRKIAAKDAKASAKGRSRARSSETVVDDPRVVELLADMKLCDRRNDAWVALDWSRPTLGEDVEALGRVRDLNPAPALAA